MLALAAALVGCLPGRGSDGPSSSQSSGATPTPVGPEALEAGLGKAVTRDESPGGAVVVAWEQAEANPRRLVEEIEEHVSGLAGYRVSAVEVGDGGGIIAFEGGRDGHYFVTRSGGRGARIELRVDAPRGAWPMASPAASAVALPQGFPLEVVPIFPGAVPAQAGGAPLPSGGSRFELALAASREPVEVLGFYADHLEARGWSVTLAAETLEARSADGASTLSIRIESRDPTVARLVLVQEPPA